MVERAAEKRANKKDSPSTDSTQKQLPTASTVLPPLINTQTRYDDTYTYLVPVPTSSTINSQVAVSILSAIMSGPNPVQRTALQVSEAV
jgi:hypothetical protein